MFSTHSSDSTRMHAATRPHWRTRMQFSYLHSFLELVLKPKWEHFPQKRLVPVFWKLPCVSASGGEFHASWRVLNYYAPLHVPEPRSWTGSWEKVFFLFCFLTSACGASWADVRVWRMYALPCDILKQLDKVSFKFQTFRHFLWQD